MVFSDNINVPKKGVLREFYFIFFLFFKKQKTLDEDWASMVLRIRNQSCPVIDPLRSLNDLFPYLPFS